MGDAIDEIAARLMPRETAALRALRTALEGPEIAGSRHESSNAHLWARELAQDWERRSAYELGVVFPFLSRLEACGKVDELGAGEVPLAVRPLLKKVTDEDPALARRRLALACVVERCGPRAARDALDAFEEARRRHESLETNVIFPRSLARETDMWSMP